MNQDYLLTPLETTMATAAIRHCVHTSYLEFLTAALFYGSGNSSEMGSNLPKFSELPKKQWEDSTVGFPESKGQILSTIPRSLHEGTDFQ